ncbi:MAG: tetratricopeptide repeat protein [Lentisphaerota bacterium]
MIDFLTRVSSVKNAGWWLTGLMSLVCCPASWTESTPPMLALSLPGLSWAVEIPADGFKMVESELSPDTGAARWMAQNKESGIILSAFLEKAPAPGDAKACRDYYWSRAVKSPFAKEQIKMSEQGGLALVEYIVPDHLEMELNQRNLNAYMAEGEYWVDIHLSKMDAKDEEGCFSNLVAGIHINRAYVPSAFDYFNYGNRFYTMRQFAAAIPLYEKAIGLEKANSTLDPMYWKVLVDQLGMAYGMSGELEKSKTLYEWAITQDPNYPMFYYNLACTWAEMDNLDEALKILPLAFENKTNMLPGEVLPNPRHDSSFRKYLSDKRFTDALEQLK